MFKKKEALRLCVFALKNRRSAEERDDVDLDAGVFWQSGSLDGRTRGLRRAEKRRVDVVHRREVAEIGQVDRRADNLLKRGAARLAGSHRYSGTRGWV